VAFLLNAGRLNESQFCSAVLSDHALGDERVSHCTIRQIVVQSLSKLQRDTGKPFEVALSAPLK
jgi:hypothetical protein